MSDRYTIYAECQNCGWQFTKDFPCGEKAGIFECVRCKCQCACRKQPAPIQYVPSLPPPMPYPVLVPYVAPAAPLYPWFSTPQFGGIRIDCNGAACGAIPAYGYEN